MAPEVPRQRLANASRREAGRPNRLKLWLRRRRALLRPLAIGVAALAVLGGVVLAVRAADPAGRALRFAEGFAGLAGRFGFTVQEVIVENRRYTSVEALREALGVGRGDPTLAFSPQEAKERLERLGWVLSADVERRLPGTIVVRLAEREPFAIWQNQQRFAVIDRTGQVVATERVDQYGTLPLVVGPGAGRHAAALHDVLLREPEVMSRTQAMVRVGERRWNLKLHNNADVMLPEGHEAAAVRRLAELQREQRLLDRPLAVIDLRMPDRLVVRRQPEAPAPAAAPAAAPATARSGRG